LVEKSTPFFTENGIIDMNYTEAIIAAVTADETRELWSLSQWRSYFLETVTEIPAGTKITSTGILAALGPVTGATLVSGIEGANAVVGKLLSPSEGGLDVTHKDAATFFAQLIAGGLATQEQIDAVLESCETVRPRYALLGLPDPRERIIKQALLEISK